MEARPGIRRRREGWASGRKTTLTSRDLDMLYLIGICGIVRTRDVTRYFFGSRATANDRLRKVYCAGFLECFVPDLAADNFYALTSTGREAVLAAHDVDSSRLHVVRKLPKKLAHTLAITEVRLHFAIACRASTHYALAAFETDADLAAERHAGLLELIPDAKVVIEERATSITQTVFVEVDLGSEPVNWLIRHKLATYARYAALGTSLYGVRDPLIVLVVPGLRRARNIARALVAERLAPRLVFALAPELTEQVILGTTYALAQDLTGDDVNPSTVFGRRLLP